MIVKLIISLVVSYVLYKLFFSKRKALYSLNVARLTNQSRVLESEIHVNTAYVHVDRAHQDFNECKTLYDAFKRGLKNGPQNHCLGHKGQSTPYMVILILFIRTVNRISLIRTYILSPQTKIQSTPLNRDKSPGTKWFPYIEASTKFHRLIGNSA